MSINRFHIPVFGLLLIVPSHTHAAEQNHQTRDIFTLKAGATVENVVRVNTRLVPLPAGQWTYRFSSRGEPPPRTRVSDEIERVFLTQKNEGAYSAGLMITVNRKPGNGDGWPRPSDVCDRNNVHFNQSDRNYTNSEADCWQLNHFVNTFKMPREPAYWQAKRWARENARSTSFFALQFRINDAFDRIGVDIQIDPLALQIQTPKETDWRASVLHRDFVVGDARKEAAISTLKGIGARYHKDLRRAFKGELNDYVSAISLYPVH